MKQGIFKKIESYLDYALKLQENLIKIPALSPVDGGEGEYDKAQYLIRELKKLKFNNIKVINAPDKRAKKGVRPNIIARYKGQSSKKTVWIMSHLDTVPVGDKSLWKYPPHKMTVKGDKIFGRGSQDNNQGIVSSMLTAKALMDLKITPPLDIALLFVADEEHESNYGIKYLLQKHGKLFDKKDMFIVPDAGNWDGTQVEVAEKSIMWLKFTVLGKQAHGSDSHLGINSLNAAGHLIVNLEKLNKKFGEKNKIFVPPQNTFEVTKVQPNVPNINAIPGKTVFYADYRILPQHKLSNILKETKKIIRQIEQKKKAKIKLEIVKKKQAPAPTPEQAQIVQLVLDAAKKIYRVNPKPQGIGGGTVASHLRLKGYHTVVYQRNDLMDHLSDEYCKMFNLLGDAKIFALSSINAR